MREKEENTILHDLTGRKVEFQVPGIYFHKITWSFVATYNERINIQENFIERCEIRHA